MVPGDTGCYSVMGTGLEKSGLGTDESVISDLQTLLMKNRADFVSLLLIFQRKLRADSPDALLIFLKGLLKTNKIFNDFFLKKKQKTKSASIIPCCPLVMLPQVVALHSANNVH